MKRLSYVIAFILTATVCLFYNIRAEDLTYIRVYFSPNGGAEEAVIREIKQAKKFIHVAMYSFTNRKIAREIVKAQKRGVKIKIVMDRKSASNKYSKYLFLIKKGINVRLVSGKKAPRRGYRGYMHNKFAVIDNKIVITGSFNWTAAAEKLNYENLLVIKSSQLAQIYNKEFYRIWEEGE